MTQPPHITALGLPLPDPNELDTDLREYFAKCDGKLGFVPNVLKAYSFDQTKLRAFNNFYDDLMLGDSQLSKLEREMIGVVVSAANRCYYCLTAHGAAVRKLSGDPLLGEMLVMNYRAAELTPRQRGMLDFAHKIAVNSWQIAEQDREELRSVGFSDRDIWDIAAVAAFFSMTNRLASAVDMMPNTQYAGLARE
jgi:uncharacterized peroxidase-related enzyme